MKTGGRDGKHVLVLSGLTEADEVALTSPKAKTEKPKGGKR